MLPPLRTPRLPKIPFAVGNRKCLNLRCQRNGGPAARKQVYMGRPNSWIRPLQRVPTEAGHQRSKGTARALVGLPKVE